MNLHGLQGVYHRGSGLLEVVIAIAIFAGGVLAFAQYQASLVRAGMDARLRTMAATISEETIESQRRFARLSTDPLGHEFAYEDIASSTRVQSMAGVNFTISQTVTEFYWNKSSQQFESTPVAGQLNSDFKTMDITVSWENPLEFRIDESQNSNGFLGSGSVSMNTVISSAISATGSLALLDDLSTANWQLPLPD